MNEPVSFPAIHPDNKTEYRDGDRVEFVLDGREPIYRGKIIGIATRHVIDQWIVLPDEPLPGWPYSAVMIQHTFIRREGSNTPFLCMVVGQGKAAS